MPPETPDSRFVNGHLYRLLRPEFVMKYSRPLCSDAFSGFIIHDKNAVCCCFFFVVVFVVVVFSLLSFSLFSSLLSLLSSLLFYFFLKPEKQREHNQDIKDATVHLMEKVIPPSIPDLLEKVLVVKREERKKRVRKEREESERKESEREKRG